MTPLSAFIRSRQHETSSLLTLCVSLSLAFAACESKIEVDVAQGRKSSASVTSLKPITGKPGDTVSLLGSGFKSGQRNFVKFTTVSGEVISAPVTVVSETEATFVMPDGVGLGLKSLVLESNGQQTTEALNFVANVAGNTLPIIIDDASEICSTRQYIDRNGDTQTGTKNCSAGGGSTPNCTADGAGSCVVDGTTYKAAAVASLSAGNIKSGVTIAGVTGQYPSATYTLPGSSGADLTSSTFNTQVKSSATFQYFDSAGSRYTGAGDTDITAANILSGVDIFGTSGSLTAPNAWDLRVGVTAAGVTGKLKVNCRNRARSTLYNYDGSVASIPDTTVTTGTVIDYWDTIDDNNNFVSGLPPSVVSGWSQNDCGGVEAAAGDDNVWKDITTTSGGVASTCAVDSARCTMQDKISGLSWSKVQGTSRTWPQAINDCDALTHNGQSDWRLPTQKELMDAFNHGIRAAASTNWMTESGMSTWFWASSSVSWGTMSAWLVIPGYGNTYNNVKNTNNSVVCVRP